MKKLFTLLMLVALVATASAQVQFAGRKAASRHLLQRENTQRGGYSHRAPATSPGDVITEQPEGEAMRYERSGQALVVYDGVLYTSEQSDKTTLVYDPDGTTVWFKNIVNGLSGQFGDSWVRGTLSDDGTTLTVPLDQTVAWSYQFEAGIGLAWGRTVVNEDNTMVSFERDETVTEAVYTISDGKLTLQGTNGRTEFQNEIQDFVAEGLTCCYEDDGAWPGFLEWNTVLTEKPVIPAPDIINEQPEGELRQYVRTGSNIYQGWMGPVLTEQKGMADIVFDPDGKTVYLRDVVYDVASDVWVRGTLSDDGTKITVPTGQYLYWDETEEKGMVVQWMSTGVEPQLDEEGQEQQVMTLTVHLGVTEVTYTIADGTISLDNCVGDPNAEYPNNYIATGLGVVYDNDLTFCAMDFNTTYTEFVLTPAVPADPILLEDAWFDDGTEDGYSCLDFTIPSEDVDGNYINLQYTSLSVYTDDDEPFTFLAETYYNDLTEDMTEIPYEIYNSGYDFDAARIYFYRTNAGDNPLFTQRIGLQVHYDVPVVGEDGETTAVRNSSNIVYWYLNNSAVSDVKAASATGDDAYYNLMGQRMRGTSLPAGIYIHNGKKVVIK